MPNSHFSALARMAQTGGIRWLTPLQTDQRNPMMNGRGPP